MKRTHFVSVAAGLLVMLAATTSCISDKSIVYLQGANTKYAVPQEITQAFELTIQPDDELAISVTSKNAELLGTFNNNTLIGSGTGTAAAAGSTYSAQANVTSGMAYFLVDKQGNIEFPVFGTISTKGKTCKQLSAEIQNMMRGKNPQGAVYIQDAIVNTKIMSFKVTVLGDVKNAGTQTFTGERLTVLEAIGKAGDLNSSAQRENVLVIREEDGKRKTYEVNLLDPSAVFENEAYYLQQNDVVYVRPNKSVKVKGSTGYTLLSVGATVVSMLVSVVSLVIAVTKK